jgi:hypothetical protein
MYPKSFLRAVGNEDFIGFHVDAAQLHQMHDRIFERRERRAVLHGAFAFGRQHVIDTGLIFFNGKQIGRGQTARKRDDVRPRGERHQFPHHRSARANGAAGKTVGPIERGGGWHVSIIALSERGVKQQYPQSKEKDTDDPEADSVKFGVLSNLLQTCNEIIRSLSLQSQ